MVCTICGAINKHVAASCPRRPRLRDTMLSLLILEILAFGYVKQVLA